MQRILFSVYVCFASVACGTSPADTLDNVACDYETVNGLAVLEAEGLTLTEDWRVGTADAGFTGTGYIEWLGASHNNDPSFGPIASRIHVTAAGRYRLQWHTRVGQGTNATEHNDTWVRFADAADFYGRKGNAGSENRVYPQPTCNDTAFMDEVQGRAEVSQATCPAGSSREGYLKVYSSGALDWRWSTRTSDHDPHDIVVEVATAGVYTLEMAARADFSQIDRLVLHDLELPNATVQDLSLAETPCR